jgi:hypothetical protein
MQECLADIKVSNKDKDHLLSGLGVLLKLVNNIVKNPQEQKFKQIKKSNKTI